MKLTPLRGYALVTLEGMFQDTGNIIIPEKYKSKRGYIGTIYAITHKDDKPHDLKAGQRIVTRSLGGTPLKGTPYHRFPIPQIIAIIPDSAKASMPDSENPRCKHCEAKNSRQNVLLVPGVGQKLYCPICNRNEYGEVIDPLAKSSEISPELEKMLSAGLPEQKSGKIQVMVG